MEIPRRRKKRICPRSIKGEDENKGCDSFDKEKEGKIICGGKDEDREADVEEQHEQENKKEGKCSSGNGWTDTWRLYLFSSNSLHLQTMVQNRKKKQKK